MISSKGAIGPKKAYMFLGIFFRLFVAYITAKITTRAQLDIADKNIQKKLVLQNNEISSKRLETEVKIKRERLEELHKIFSKIALENSLTMRFIQSKSNLSRYKFRSRHIDNCKQLHIAEAIVALYFPELTEEVEKIYGQTNMFWGYQECVLRTDIKIN